jgi:hypothetical protein
MPDNIWHYAFDAEFPTVVRELVTDVSIFPSPNSQGIKTYAVWDTGATHSVLSPKIANNLQLIPIDSSLVSGINHSQYADIVIASIGLANGLLLPDIRFSVCDIPGTDVLIGMDIIMMGDFAISNGDGKTLFSFAIPPFKNKVSYTEKADSINIGN